MKICILQKSKMYTFLLPKTISGNYIITDYNDRGEKRSLVSVEEELGKWVMTSNSNVKIVINNKEVVKTDLQLYNFYQLLIGNNDAVTLFIMPAFEKDFIYKKMTDNSCITIGKTNKADIIYQCPMLQEVQVSLTYKDGVCTLKNLDSRLPIYVNNTVTISRVIETSDVVFILGLRIIIFGNNILINNVNNKVSIINSKLQNSTILLSVNNIDNKGEIYTDFYDEKEYYFKTPVFQNEYKKVTIAISSPPSKVGGTSSSAIMTIVPSLIMSSSSLLTGFYSLKDLNSDDPQIRQSAIMALVMCGSMMIASIIWPILEMFFSNIATKIKNFRLNRKFIKYIDKKDQLLKEAISEQKFVLLNNNVSLEQCQDIILNKTNLLYSKNIEKTDFLTIRLGVGTILSDCVIDYTEQDFVEEDDKLLRYIKNTINNNKYIENVPTSLSLIHKNKVAFISEEDKNFDYIKGLLFQLITLHSYNDLKIVIFTKETNTDRYEYIKRVHHIWSSDDKVRFFASNQSNAQTISSYLEDEFVKRTKSKDSNDGSIDYKSLLPYYLIISDDITEYRNIKIIQDILKDKNNNGFSLMLFDSKVANIPMECSYFINYSFKEGACFENVMDGSDILRFVPEFLNDSVIDLNKTLSYLANIPVKTINSIVENLPEKYGFLEMFGVGKIEQLNILNRWKNSNIINSLATPVGVDSMGNTIELDLHEKKHGPHGLIAGMTGSGKSEFIVTYILSLAVNYSPNEVQFVLIDYKGGGLAGAFENRKTGVKLPHLVGTITNLDKSEMKRTLVSIKSELQRRQKLFNDAKEKLNTGTIDIYKYQKLVRSGKLDLPLAHLFIICDEFAELKAQQPDFMDELVSTARIGRSLGVHLILATQKPSGVVDEQIWSNSKFKVCCKVQTAEDSNEMLRKPDAAFIKEVGRFYLQVGYDESYVMGQSAYTGTQYIPSSKARSKVDNSIDFIDEVGDVVRSIEKDTEVVDNSKEVNLGEELINILAYIIELSQKNGFESKQLWLDNVPQVLYLDSVRKKYPLIEQPFNINPLIGEYDDPQHQLQGPVELPITTGGNTFITGVAGSGKSTLLSTIVYSIMTTHKVDEVNFYIIDLLAESLKKFALAPQVGEVLTINEKSKIEKLFYYLQRIVEKRKNYYSVNGGSFEQDVKNGKSLFPNIIVMINGFDIFKEQFESVYEDLLAPFTRDCTRTGVTFIVTGVNTNSLGYMIENNFPTTIAMRLLDPNDYAVLFSNNGIVPNTNPGRGLIKLDDVFEFQTSLIFDYSNLDSNLNYIIQELIKVMPKKADKIPTIPNVVTIESFKNDIISLDALPVGIEIKSACSYYYNFNQLINMITFSKEQSAKNFVPALINLFSYLNNVKTIVLSAYEYLEIQNDNIKFYNGNFKKVFEVLKNNFEKLINDSTNNNQYVITIFGYTKLNTHLLKLKEEDDEIVTVEDLIMLVKDSNKIHFVLIDTCSLLKNIDDYSWYNLTTTSNGILLAEEFDNQDLFMAKDDYNNNGISRDEAIAVKDGTKYYIKYVNK